MSGGTKSMAVNGEPGDDKMTIRVSLTPEQLRARRRRNIAIALAIAAFALFFYVITIAKLGVGVLNRPL